MDRRSFLTSTATLSAGSLFANHHLEQKTAPAKGFFLALKDNMIKEGKTLEEKYRLVKELGYDGIEVHAPKQIDLDEARTASKATHLPIHGVVNAVHWRTKLSDPSAEQREKALQLLLECIRESHAIGGTSVLLVPGVVDGKTTTQKQAWERSIPQIQKALPLAARLGIHIILENVWNGMFYDPKGPNTQTADRLAKYIDEVNSPWLGSYFDIGNHQRFGKPAEWIRTLGKRIVKLDVKDWGIKGGFGKLGEGDVDWPAVRTALKDINYQGWATAEVRGGNKERLAEVLKNMRTHLLGLS